MLHHAAALRRERRQRRARLVDMATAAVGGEPVRNLFKRLTD